MNVTGLAAFCASKKMSRLAMAIQRVYNDCEGPKSFIKSALGIAPNPHRHGIFSYSTYRAADYAASRADGPVPADSAH